MKINLRKKKQNLRDSRLKIVTRVSIRGTIYEPIRSLKGN